MKNIRPYVSSLSTFWQNYQFVRFGNEKNRFFAAQPSGNLQKRLDFRV
jgi:hypothetical protein